MHEDYRQIAITIGNRCLVTRITFISAPYANFGIEI